MHKHFLLQALTIAEQYRGFCSPNPSVGAIIVHDNVVIAQGAHCGVGSDHAEIVALNQVKQLIKSCTFDEEKLKNSTIYVTLEPCNHYGHTPPCVDAIKQSGIKRVIFAYLDPNPLVKQNNTPKLLNDAGVDVEHFPVEQINQFYQSYSHWSIRNKPYISSKLAISADGKVAANGGKAIAITGVEANNYTHLQRYRSDVILTTAKTVNTDNPRLNARVNGKAIAKKVAIIDRLLTLKGELNLYHSAQQLLIFHDEKLLAPSDSDTIRYYGVSNGETGLDLLAIITKLGEIGFHDVWVEAGPSLFNQLHRQNLVNKTLIYIGSKWLGDAAVSANLTWINQLSDLIKWQQIGCDVLATITHEENNV